MIWAVCAVDLRGAIVGANTGGNGCRRQGCKMEIFEKDLVAFGLRCHKEARFLDD